MTPTLETIEGNPAANASIRELGIPSFHDGRTNMSHNL